MQVEYINFNEDERLNPEIVEVPLSRDGKNQPPSFCLAWVEATRVAIQIRANHEYRIRKSAKSIEAWIQEGRRKIPMEEKFAPVPQGVAYFAKNEKEEKGRLVSLGETPSFSSPWQSKSAHSVTLKLGISWWTPPGWGLFFTSAVHRNEEFRVVEGFVRTDLWHRDIPIVVQPLREEIRIPKYSVVASVLAVSAEGVELVPARNKEEKIGEIALQTSFKRMSQHYYKALVRGSGKKKPAKS